TGICGGPLGTYPPLTSLPCLPLTLFGFRLLTFRVDVFFPLDAIFSSSRGRVPRLAEGCSYALFALAPVDLRSVPKAALDLRCLASDFEVSDRLLLDLQLLGSRLGLCTSLCCHVTLLSRLQDRLSRTHFARRNNKLKSLVLAGTKDPGDVTKLAQIKSHTTFDPPRVFSSKILECLL